MARPQTLPAVNEIERMLREGMTYAEIGAKYNVTPSAVYKKLKTYGNPPKMPTYRDILPWTIEREHMATAPMKRIRTLVAKQSGKPVDAADERLLEDWIAGMEHAGVVLNYHPEAPINVASSKGGFYYSPRRPGEEGIFRAPGSE